ncbi:hypothetical protein Bca4012_098113 [Brassica carinata]
MIGRGSIIAAAVTAFFDMRLSDVPELSEIVKQFTTKYGKDFATSAIELRPDSGVSRLLICFILVPLTVLDLTRYVDMISNPEVAYVLRKRQAPDIMNEMSESTTIQGFISTHFLPRFKEELKPNTIYKLNGFSIRPSKSVCRVSPHKHGISFNNKTTFAPVHEVDCQIDSQHFRIRDLQVFTDIVDKHTDLLDIIGFLRVINGDNLDTQTPMATAPAPAGERSKDMVFLHVQLEDGKTARVYLWDKIAAAFRSRWNDSKTKPSVILLTTLNSKTLGGVVTLSSTASTRLFFDSDIIETEKLLSRFEADGKIPPTVNRYRFEVKVCDDSGNEGTFVIFDKEALKLVVRQAPDVMNEMSEVRTIEKFNRAYVSV